MCCSKAGLLTSLVWTLMLSSFLSKDLSRLMFPLVWTFSPWFYSFGSLGSPHLHGSSWSWNYRNCRRWCGSWTLFDLCCSSSRFCSESQTSLDSYGFLFALSFFVPFEVLNLLGAPPAFQSYLISLWCGWCSQFWQIVRCFTCTWFLCGRVIFYRCCVRYVHDASWFAVYGFPSHNLMLGWVLLSRHMQRLHRHCFIKLEDFWWWAWSLLGFISGLFLYHAELKDIDEILMLLITSCSSGMTLFLMLSTVS